MTAYSELLRDPRWQRTRLEIMERENFTCQECGAADKTLNVHHTYYAKGRAPWEYELESLHCLCENCHAARHARFGKLPDDVPPLPDWITPDMAREIVADWSKDERAPEVPHPPRRVPSR